MTPDTAPGHSDPAPRVAAFSSHSELARRVVSALIMAPLAVITAYAGGWWLAIFWGAVAIGIFWEWCRLIFPQDHRSLMAVGGAALLIAIPLLATGRWHATLYVLALGALGTVVFAPAERRLWAGAGVFCAAIALLAPVTLDRDAQFGFMAIMFLFAVVWSTDVLGYFVGRAVGGVKLAPRISPKKTWSGAVGGSLAAVAAGMATAALFGLHGIGWIGVTALVLAIAAQAGDLAESALKRFFGAKDSGWLIPGHGGLMDRLDGFMAAAIAAIAIGWLRAGMDVARGLMQW